MSFSGPLQFLAQLLYLLSRMLISAWSADNRRPALLGRQAAASYVKPVSSEM